VRGNTPTRKQKRQSAAAAYATGIRADDSIIGSEIVGTLNTSDAKMISNQYVDENKCVVEPYIKSRRAHLVTDYETWVQEDVTPTLNSFDVGEIRATTAIVEPMFAFDTQFGSNANVTENVSPTLKSSQQSPSIAYTDEQMVIRRLTPLECERLMGWPDDHTRWKADGTKQSDTTRYKQCGNGVASPVAQWIGKQIISL
jgi:site-specific DNA-cytosine methylase